MKANHIKTPQLQRDRQVCYIYREKEAGVITTDRCVTSTERLTNRQVSYSYREKVRERDV